MNMLPENRLLIWNKYASRLLMVSFFLPMKWQVYATGIVCLFFLLQSFKTKKYFSSVKLLFLLLTGSGLLLCLFSLPLTPPEYRHVLWNIMERKLSLLIIPLIFLAFNETIVIPILKEQLYFVYGCLYINIVGNILFISNIIQSNLSFSTINHVQYRNYLEHALGIHPTYLGIYICFSISILLVQYPTSSLTHKFIKSLLLLTLLLFLSASFAKAPALALLIILIYHLLQQKAGLKKNLIYATGFVVLLAILYLTVPFFGQRLQEMKWVGAQKSTSGIHDNSINERKLVFNTDLSLLKNNWVTGVGPGRLQEQLNIHYLFTSIQHQVYTKQFDPHSEFLWQWLSFGIAGLILFFMMLCFHYYFAIKSQNRLYLYLLFLFSVTFFTESVLARQHGVMLFAVFISIYFLSSREKRLPLGFEN